MVKQPIFDEETKIGSLIACGGEAPMERGELDDPYMWDTKKLIWGDGIFFFCKILICIYDLYTYIYAYIYTDYILYTYYVCV